MIDATRLREVWRASAARSGAARRAWAVHVGVGAALAAWVATGGEVATTRWLWGTLAIGSIAMLRVPFVLFWRDDAALLSRLPIPGRALWLAALSSTAELSAQAAAAAAIGALPLATAASGLDVLARCLALVGALAASVAALVPAVAVAAGALVVSGKADQLLAGMGGEVKAPPTSWLGLLPGVASALVVLVGIALAPWLEGGAPHVGHASWLLGGIVAGAALAAAWAFVAADRVMPAMLRDVSALDRQQLATLQLDPAPRTLLLLGRALRAPARLVLDKHARMMARRYPMAGVVGFLVAAWLVIGALVAPSALASQVMAVASGLAYALVLRSRLGCAPVELLRLADSLPWTRADRDAAARAYLCWWWSWAVLLPSVVAAVRGLTPWPVASALAAAMVLVVRGAR